jgi:hypothetical protein
MAHANNSLVTGKLKGILGKELVFREWEGKTVVAKAPKSREGEPSPAQAETQDRFKFASRYARAIIRSPDKAWQRLMPLCCDQGKTYTAGRWKIS